MNSDRGSQSLPLSESPRRILAEIVSRYGVEICDSPAQVEALLRDLCGEYRREINLLMSAQKDKVAADLLSASVTPAELLIGRLTTRLRDNHSLTDEAARWAVESWALALGRITREQLSAPAPAPLIVPPPPPPAPAPYNTAPPQYVQPPSGQVMPPYPAPVQMQPPTTWPPPVQPPYGQQMMPNTSGTLGPIPPEIMAMRWSWPAFFWNWLWMCNHGLAGGRVLLFISCFIPYVNLISIIYLGINGNQLAWQYRRFDSIDHFKRVQSTWGMWALWWFLGGLAFEVVVLIIAGIAGSNNH